MTTPRLLGDRYELGETLGYGGMAEVHRGRDTRLGREVAIKVLRQDLARDNGFQARFEREAQNSASLNHPEIVAVYDTGEEILADETRLPYIVMEYVEGRTLRDILAEGGRLLPQRALEIMADVCAALEFSHRNGIIHRDIKPGNVMLTPSGQVKVMDFGIARSITSASSTITQTSAVMGTAQYLSPEQARGESVDARSDVYSAGCLLYELLSGHPPFTGDSPLAVAYQHVREDPVPPSEVNPDVTPAMDAVVMKSLAKNPANRYQSAGEMRADVLRACAGRAVEATPVLSGADRTRTMGPAEAEETQLISRPEQQRRRRRIWPWLALVLVLAAVGAGATFATMALIGPRSATVPSVIGKTEAAARNALQNRGFRVKVTNVHGSDKNKGKVTAEDPKAGTSFTIGKAVTITVDQGIARVKVPPVKGLSVAQAKAKLKLMGLSARPRSVDNRAKAGTVVGAKPGVGTLAAVSNPVILYVANGTVPVPSVIGLGRSEAIARLQSDGLNADTTVVQTSQTSPGIVFAQTPDGGRLQPGSTVTISVATAPPPPPPSPSPTTPAPTPSGPSPTPSGTPSSSPSPAPTPTPTPSSSGGAGGGGGGSGHHKGGGGGGDGGGGHGPAVTAG